ncbi:hypothetical protein HW555_005503, partial [Spodoptera exigua]
RKYTVLKPLRNKEDPDTRSNNVQTIHRRLSRRHVGWHYSPAICVWTSWCEWQSRGIGWHFG